MPVNAGQASPAMKSKLAAALGGALGSSQQACGDIDSASQQPEMDEVAATMSSLPEGLQKLAQQGLLPVSSQRLQVCLSPTAC